MALMSQGAEVIISMGCLLFTPSHALDRCFLISKPGAAPESVQIRPPQIWTPGHSSCMQMKPPTPPREKPASPAAQSHLGCWQVATESEGSTTEKQRLCLEAVTGQARVCLCLLLPSREQDGVIRAFYISMAEEAASRWRYLFQSHLFMQKEGCVTSLPVNAFCKPWERMLKKWSWAIFHVRSNVQCVYSCWGLACGSILKGRLPFPIFFPFLKA